MVTVYIILLAILCGVFGRMGGSGGRFRSWQRDWLCPLITLIALWLLIGLHLAFWWAYLISYALMGLSLTTYYDKIFGYDNLWFAGWIAGLASSPLLFTGIHLYALIPRAFLLAIIWGRLNRYLPSGGILTWRRDIAEEFLRYTFLVLTLPILKI